MPSVEHETVVKAPLQVVWDYIKDMGNWAPFLEGYQKHEEINDTESIWILKGDVGVLCRIVKMKITITEWVEQEKVAFSIKGISERATGEGVFLLLPETPATLQISTFNLHWMREVRLDRSLI